MNGVKTPLSPLRPVLYDVPSDTVRVLDQRKLPACEEWLTLRSADEVIEAIKSLTIRGAPAIGVVAAFALACEARRGAGPAELAGIARKLVQARPTAVNLAWAAERMSRRFESSADALLAEAQAIRDEDEAACRRIGELGAPLIPIGAKILTHCNAGALATAGYGTALGVVRAAFESGNPISVLADETRPFLQGARLTAWELHRDGIPVTIITDNMAGWLMHRGEISCVIVGADRIARNGDTANKVGTYSLAVLAAHHHIPFYIAAPWSTVDLATPSGEQISIEERPSEEVLFVAGSRIGPEGVSARYPAFDVTPAAMITAIVTERGIVRAPIDAALSLLATEPGH